MANTRNRNSVEVPPVRGGRAAGSSRAANRRRGNNEIGTSSRESTPERDESRGGSDQASSSSAQHFSGQVPASVAVKLDLRNYKLDGNTAMKILDKNNFPKLDGPSNFMGWEREFKKAMVMSGYIGFFNGAYEKVPGLKETPWYELGLAQATEYLKESCGKDKELEIQDLDDPKEAYKQLQASSRAIGNSHYCSLQRKFQGTTQASCGTAKEFKATMLKINRELALMHPKYEKPVWEMNSWFINNLTDAYENKVSALSSDPKVIAVEGGMSFDELTLQIIEEEQRLTDKHGGNLTTVATTTVKTGSAGATDPTELTLRFNAVSAEMAKLTCKRCGKPGHADVVGPSGCFHNPENKHLKEEFFKRIEKTRGRSGKRSGNGKERENSTAKRKKIETKDFSQDQKVEIAEVRTYAPAGWSED